jgi:WD40 repeat protein
LESSRLGCFRVKFVGNYLYAACSDKNTTVVKVFKLEDGEKVMTFKGHRGIIYSLNTNSNPPEGKEKYMITAASDHFVRIWKIP